jgi:PAS domain-containing protein
MYLVQIFRASPLMGMALCICLATILWCFLMAKRQRSGLDKILTGVLGLISTYEAIRVLKDSGVVLFPGMGKLDGWVDFLIACMYLIAALILKISASDHTTTQVKLRLVEANEKTIELGKGVPMTPSEAATLLDASPLTMFAVDGNGFVVYWNAAAERLLGWKRDEVLGQPLPVAGRGPLRNKQGQRLEAAIWTAPIRSNGSARGTLTIAADKSSLLDIPSKVELAVPV